MLLVEDAHDTGTGLECVVAGNNCTAHVGSRHNRLDLAHSLVVVVLSHADLSVTEVESHSVDLHEYLAILRRGKGALFEA
jgi:hypothetical protein